MFFGNHPGGKFLEIFDMLLLLWICVSLFRIKNITRFTFVNGFEWLFLLSGLFSILFNPTLILEIINIFKKNPTLFNIFSANEANPIYVLKMLLTTLFSIVSVLIIYNIYIEKGIEIINKFSIAITISLLLSAIVGIFETHIPVIQSSLHTYRYFIDGYSEPSLPAIIPIVSLFQKTYAMQSFFWNRGWFAVFIIASIPFVNITLNNYLYNSANSSKQKVLLWFVYFIFIFYILLLVGARGAYLSFLFLFLSFLFFNIMKDKIIYNLRYVIPGMIIVALALIPLLVAYTNVEPSGGGRFDHFNAGIETFIRNIFFGCGIEGYGVYNLKYLIPAGIGSKWSGTHNQLLQIAAGQGLFGVSIYLSLIYYILFSLIKSASVNKQYVVSLLSGFIGILVYSSFQEWYYLRSSQLFWWLLIMTTMVNDKSNIKTEIFAEYKKNKQSFRLFYPIAFLVILSVTVFFCIETYKTSFGSKGYKALVQSEWWPLKNEYGYYEEENWDGAIMRWTGKKSSTSVKASGDLVQFKVVASHVNSAGPEGLKLKVSINDLFEDTHHFFGGGDKELRYYIPGIKDKDIVDKDRGK